MTNGPGGSVAILIPLHSGDPEKAGGYIAISLLSVLEVPKTAGLANSETSCPTDMRLTLLARYLCLCIGASAGMPHIPSFVVNGERRYCLISVYSKCSA